MIGNILMFGWRNILRNKRRTFFTLSAVVFGIMALIFVKSFANGFTASTGEAMIKTQTGHVRIADKEFLRLERILPREHMVSDVASLEKSLSGIPGVKMVNSMLKFNVLLNRGDIGEPAIAIGVDPQRAAVCMELPKTVTRGKYLEGQGLQMLIGKRLAEKMKVNVNDELLLVTTDINYSTYALPFRITGIFETGLAPMDKHTLYIPLKKAQELLDCAGSVHECQVFIDDAQAAPETAEKIKEMLAEQRPGNTLDVMPWQKHELFDEMLPFMMTVWESILRLIMFIVALVILNTMLMTVMERYHEIGVMKAMGLKNGEIFSMVMAEAFFIGTIGSLLGGALGAAVSAWTETVGLDFAKMVGQETMNKIDFPLPVFGNVIYPDLTLEIVVGSVIFGIVVSLIAVLYPAFKSMRMQPVEAFRSKLHV